MLKLTGACVAWLVAAGTSSALGADNHPPLVVKGVVSATHDEVWDAIATTKGAETYFAPEALVGPKVGEPYDMHFAPTNPPGMRGAEGRRILAREPNYRLMVTWDAPPKFGPLRHQDTIVQFDLEPVGDKTLVTITQFGWGSGDGWKAVRDSFDVDWKIILGRLQYRFDNGPVDWSKIPDGLAYYRPFEE